MKKAVSWHESVAGRIRAEQCYERGRYASVVDKTRPLQPPLPDVEAAWAHEVLATQAHRS